MSDRSYLEKKAEELHLEDLPIPAYVVERNGRFVLCNKKAISLLRLSVSDYKTDTIARFYSDRMRRERLIDKAAQHGDALEKEIITLSIEHQTLYVQDHCRLIRNVETKNVVGCFGLLVNVTDDEGFRINLPVGVYQVDSMGDVVYTNDAMVRILGYKNADEILHRQVSDLYVDPAQELAFEKKLRKSGQVVDEKVELFKADGGKVWLSASAFKLGDDDGEHVPRKGVLVDVTLQELYRQILEYTPIGLYMVESDGKRNIIKHCNEHFARMFEFRSFGDAMGKEAETVHASPEDTLEYMTRLSESETVRNYVLNAKTVNGRRRLVLVNAQAIRNSSGKITGRVGALLDITEDTSNKEQVQEFTHGFGGVLHAYSTTLTSLNQAIRAAKDYIGQDNIQQNRMLTAEEIDRRLSESVDEFLAALTDLLSMMSKRRAVAPLTTIEWSKLNRRMEQLRNPEKIAEEPALRVWLIHDTVKEITATVGGFPKDPQFSKEMTLALNEASNVIRVCNLIALHNATFAVLDTDYQVSALREYVTLGVRHEDMEIRQIDKVVEQAITMLSPTAYNYNVQIQKNFKIRAVQVRVSVRDIIRVLGNLLDNAIKYSWKRTETESSWVEVRIRIENAEVLIEFEDWGVAIPIDDLESGILFKIGQRGRLPGERRRKGTGCGLADARRVARNHGGDVTLSSRPARKSSPTDYSQPFLTTATLRLPIYQGANE